MSTLPKAVSKITKCLGVVALCGLDFVGVIVPVLPGIWLRLKRQALLYQRATTLIRPKLVSLAQAEMDNGKRAGERCRTGFVSDWLITIPLASASPARNFDLTCHGKGFSDGKIIEE